TGCGKALAALGTDPGGAEPPADPSIFVDAEFLEHEDVLHGDHVAFHAGNLRNRGHFARAVRQTSDLHDNLDCGRDLLPNSSIGNIEIRHRNHRVETIQGVPWAVGVDRGQTPVMPGIHRLQHVQSLFATDLADDDAVGTHTKGVDHKLTLTDVPLSLDVG